MVKRIYLKQFTETPNVGDAISELIVARISGRRIEVVGEAAFDRPNLIAGGSIAHWSDRYSVLWGCGLISDRIVPSHAPARVLAVRGTLTRDRLRALGVPAGELVGDVAVLLPEIVAGAAPVRHRLGLVPHYVDRDSSFVDEWRRLGVAVLDVGAAPDAFVRGLTSCERIVSSSLHGIVLAHAYGIPAAWVELSDRVHGNGFKFFDYYSSLGVAARDVERNSPGAGIARLAERCWLPPALPQKDRLREALLTALAELDVG